MDSWSRPSKSQATPAPYYLTQEDAKYCYTCGRIIGDRRANTSKATSTEVKYCSDRCKRNKPTAGDRDIETVLLALLQGDDLQQAATGGEGERLPSKAKRKAKKGDPRIVVKMSELEIAAFGDTKDPERIYGRYKKRAKRGVPEPEEWRSIDMEEHTQQTRPRPVESYYDYYVEHNAPVQGSPVAMQNHVRPQQHNSDVNGSVGGEKGWAERIEESSDMLQKRLEGQKRAENRELARNAARRAVVFGLPVTTVNEAGTYPKQRRGDGSEPETVLRKCEALMNGTVVEPSFAKGDWQIRWRED